MSSIKEKILVAAIDFGTTYSGYALSFKHDYEIDPTKVSISTWSSGSHLSFKQPTCVLCKPNGTFHSFGYDAENKYASLAEENKHRNWYFYRRFKMVLHKSEIKQDLEMPDETGLIMPAKTVFGYAIRFLKTHMLSTLDRQGTGVNEKDILWVLTVPAIWSDTAKHFLRTAAVTKAGIDSSALTIALEPEAAYLYCQLLPSDRMPGSGRLTANKYMILNLGGSTADITVYEKQADGTRRELHVPTGGPWGGAKVDEAFHQMLIKIFGAKTFKKFCDSNPSDHLDMLRELEMKKRIITSGSDDKITLRIPISLIQTYEEASGEKVAEAIKRTTFSGKIIVHADKLRIEPSVLKGLFQKCIDGVKQCVTELLQKSEVKDVDILMVGGLSESPLMQTAMKENFPNVNIIIPTEAGLSVLKGGVLLGFDANKLTTRIARYTYGFSISPPFDRTIHPREKRIVLDGTERCKDVFMKYIEIGEPVQADERRSGKHVILKNKDAEMILKMYASTAKDPQFVTEPGCKYIGRLIVKLPEEQSTFTVNVHMMFGGTELSVQADEETTGRKLTSYIDFL